MIIFIPNDIWACHRKIWRIIKKALHFTYAKNLKGNLLFVHGTGDDNVHYQNTEMLINELVKNGKCSR